MTNGGMPNPFHTEQLSPHGLAHVVAGLSQGSGNTGGMGGGVGTGSVDSVHGDMDFDFGSLNIGPSLFQGSLPKEYQGLLDPGQGQGQGQGREAVPAPPPSLLTSSPSRLHDVNMGAGHATAYVSTQGGGGGLANVTSGIKSLTSMPSGLAFNNSEISHIERIFGIGKPPASHGQQAGGGGQEASMNEGAAGTSNAQGGLLGGPGSLVLPVGLSSSLNLPVQMRHLVTTGSGLHNMQSIEQLGILGGDKRNL